MEDAEEIDILGDFDYKSSAGIPDEDPELPSHSVQLLPEFSQHPWLLEQGWSLDHCMDERSRAVIEKMLLEEQSYTDGRMKKSESVTTVKSDVKPMCMKTDKKITSHKKSSWSKEERSIFFQGYNLYGRRWSKIAQLIPSKTHQQVKNYALHHIKHKKITSEAQDSPQSGKISQIPLMVNTTTEVPFKNIIKPKASSGPKNTLAKGDTSRSVPGLELSEVIRIKKKSDSDSDSDIDVEVNSDDDGNISQCSNVGLTTNITADSIDNDKISSNERELTSSSHGSTPAGPGELNVVSCNSFPTDENQAGHGYSEATVDSSVTPETVKSSDTSVCLDNQHVSVGSSSVIIDSVNKNLCSNSYVDDLAEGPAANTGIGEDQPLDEKGTDQHCGEYPVLQSDGQLIYLPNPEKEVIISQEEISNEEKLIHADFFYSKNNTKTPERYLRIRNHIIDCWKKTKPCYLKKTAVRNGLRNCGDVNCVGRIHSYLEQIGAINFGCEQAQYKQPCRQIQSKPTRYPQNKETMERMKLIRRESMRPRKRRIRDSSGEWADVQDLEGKTIQHEENLKNELKLIKSTVKQRYNPFVLIPCKKYNEDHPAPYSISLSAAALVVMDTHAHLAKTEVIGLLGGHFDDKLCELVIMTAEPCDSLSTSMQCEMDPVSQTQACERLQAKGQSIVGWYHSHPSFDAQPSVRDMETQTEFQNWFANDGNSFVGIIISPYNRNCLSVFSDIRCLMVEKENNQTVTPYEFKYNIQQRSDDVDDIISVVQKLADLYSNYPNKVLLSSQFRSTGSLTCLDKLLHSISRHFNVKNCGSDNNKLVQKLKERMQHILE